MTLLDWAVLSATILGIVVVGVWKNRRPTTSDAYLRGGYELRWPTIGLSVMATQASAITFLSVPGQAYEDGMRFVQFYFGLPLAMIVVSAVFVPIYYRLHVFTAYEYLEQRFDVKVRLLGAFLFLIQRGLAAGITLYAPAIILSTILGWPLEPTVVVIGALVIVYTVTGGSKAVSQTQKQQMIVMMGGMCLAAIVIAWALPEGVGVVDASHVAGALGRMRIVDFGIDMESRYTFWSGLTGGFFLALSYFGTDQSQVGRYLTAKNIAESRLGLLMNGVLKIPMQAFILFVGVLMFAFYQWTAPPLFFNESLSSRVAAAAPDELSALDDEWRRVHGEKARAATAFVEARAADDAVALAHARAALVTHHKAIDDVRARAKALASERVPGAETKDSDYVFLTFVKRFMPSGLFGLLIAVILSAAMSSIASELSALGTTTTIDFYKRLLRRDADDRQTVFASKAFTVMWGLVAIGFASFAALLDNLIQAVNILGSLFYGTVLGLFVVAFFIRRVGARAVLFGALVAQSAVIALYFTSSIGYLWFNVIGCAIVVVLSLAASFVVRERAVTA